MKRIPAFAAFTSALLLAAPVLAQDDTTDTQTDDTMVPAPDTDSGTTTTPETTPDAGATEPSGVPADPLIEDQPRATPEATDPANGTTDVPADSTDMPADTTDAPATTDMPAATDTFIVPEGYTELTDWTTVTADQLMGATLYSADGSNIGEVSDIELSTDGPVAGIVVDVGGFLGIGVHTVSLGAEEVKLYRDEGGTVIAHTNLTADALQAQPEYVKPQ